MDVSRGSERFRLIISDDLFTDVHVNALRSLTCRSESLAPDSLPFAGFRGVEDVAENRRDYFAKFLGVPEKVVQKVLREGEGQALEQPRTASTAPGGATFPKPAVSEPRPAPLSTPASACPPWSPVDLAIRVGVVPTSIFPATKASTVLTPATTASARPSTEPSSTTVTASAKPSTEPSSTTTAPLLDIAPASIRSFPPRQKESDALPPPPSQSYRATKLLELGGMAQWQPAHRSWDVEEDISFVEKDLTIFWPPKKWSTLDPQQKLLQWEFAAMQIVKARGEDYISITQTDLLDRLNFLALPRTAAQDIHRHTCKVKAGCILMNYYGPSPMGSKKTSSGCL